MPAELAGPPGVGPGEACWRLAWLRTGGAWCSALLSARRHPGQSQPWIAHARWGEDKQAAWVVVDDATLRLLPPDAPAEPGSDGRQVR